MANQRNFTLYQGAVAPADIILQPLPLADVQSIPIFLYSGTPNPNDILLSDPTFLPVFAVGKSATGLVGQMVPEIAVVLTGQAATGSVGSLVGAINGDLSASGQAATCTGGTIIPEIGALPAGRSATGTVGSIVAYEGPLNLTGQRATTAQGALDLSPHYAGMVGQRAISAAGQITPEVQAAPQGVQATGQVGYGIGIQIVDAGSTTIILYPVPTPNDIILYPTAQPSKTQIGVEPLAATSVVFDGDPWFGRGPRVDIGGTGSVAANPTIVQHQGTFSFTYSGKAIKRLNLGNAIDNNGNPAMIVPVDLNTGVSVLGIAPTSQWGAGSGRQADVSTLLALTGASFFGPNPNLDPAFNGLTFQTFPDGTHYDHAPDNGLGGYYSFSPDGSPHWLGVRSLDWAAGDPTPPAIYYCYMPGSFNGLYRGPQITRNLTFDGIHECPMGIYAIDATHALVFYPALNGTNWVPAYRTVTQPDNSTNVTIGSEVQLTGAAGCFAINNFLVVARSGFDSTIYVVYLSAANASSSTPTKVGLIVMDAVTLNVISHTLTAVPAAATTWDIFEDPRVRAVTGIPALHRPNAKVVRLSNGTALTQFVLGHYVIRLSWTSSTSTAPTLTLKAGPVSNSGSNHYLVPGWESLEVRGDDVFHLLYDAAITGTDSQFRAFSIYSNDASGTGATWTLSGTLWNWTEFCGSGVPYVTTWLSVPGDNAARLKTYLLSVPHDNNGGATTYFNTWAWLDYWTASPYLTVTAEGKVGNVTVSIVNNEIDVPLTGLRATATANQQADGDFIWLTQGAPNPNDIILGPVPGLRGKALVPSLAIPLKTIGERLTVDVGTIVPAHDITAQLVGQVATGTAGTIVPEIAVVLTGQSCSAIGGVFSAFDVNQPLTGLQATATGGVLIPELDIPLTGQAATGRVGTLVPAIAVGLTGDGAVGRAGSLGIDLGGTLTGLAVVSSSGGLLPSLAVPYSGLRATTGEGSLLPALAIPLTGGHATSSPGALVAAIAAFLTGQLATLLRGSMGLIVDAFPHVTGVQAVGHVGTEPVTDTNVPPVPLRYHLWARSEIEKLFATVVPEKSTTVKTTADTTAELVIITLYNDEQPKE